MTVLPRPIPHPLDDCPFEVPAWAFDALEWVVGFDWPEGDEVATWVVADRWYQLAAALSGPHEDAFAAAGRIVAGYAADGVPADGFTDAWQRLAGDPGAPLNALLQITRELGEFVEEAGRALEAAKLAAWIELGEFLIELTGMAVANALTRGAASPTAGRLIATSGLHVRQIFQRLLDQMERATPRAAGPPAERAVPAGQEATRVIRPPRPASMADLPDRGGAAGRAAGAPVVEPGSMTRRLYPAQHRPAAAALSGSSTAEPLSPARAEPPRPAPESPRPASTSPPRPTSAQPARPTPAEPARPTSTQPARPTSAQPARPTSAQPAPPTSAQPARPTSAQPTRPAGSAGARTSPSAEAEVARTTRVELPRGPIASPQRVDEEDGDTVLLSPPPVPAPGRREVSGEVTRRISPAELARAAASRRLFDENQRDDYLLHLARIVADTKAKIAVQGARPELISLLAETEAQAVQLRKAKPSAAVDPPAWARTGVDPDRSTPKPYGGLRKPIPAHQTALAEVAPKALGDPRTGSWFARLNGDGPAGDPTRALNCVDAVLALFETYRLGRPRVASPRTFDNYAHGEPVRPVGGEWDGLNRLRQAVGTDFQNLCPFVGGADHALARPAVEAALRNLANHLHNTGHGAFAVIVTDLEDGGCHAWAAINQGGTVLFLDPQVGRVAADVPLYRHHGVPTASNVVSMDALVVDGRGAPAPLPFHGPGQWAAATG